MGGIQTSCMHDNDGRRNLYLSSCKAKQKSHNPTAKANKITDKSAKEDQSSHVNSDGDKVKAPRMRAPTNMEAIKLFLEITGNMARLMKKPIHAINGGMMIPLKFWELLNRWLNVTKISKPNEDVKILLILRIRCQ